MADLISPRTRRTVVIRAYQPIHLMTLAQLDKFVESFQIKLKLMI
jgi:hypothetical protein